MSYNRGPNGGVLCFDIVWGFKFGQVLWCCVWCGGGMESGINLGAQAAFCITRKGRDIC